MMCYEQFVNCVLLPKTSSGEAELPFLAINLMTRFGKAFALLKSRMGPIIRDYHVPLASAGPGCIKDLAVIAKFQKEHWNADIANLSKIFEEANK